LTQPNDCVRMLLQFFTNAESVKNIVFWPRSLCCLVQTLLWCWKGWNWWSCSKYFRV